MSEKSQDWRTPEPPPQVLTASPGDAIVVDFNAPPLGQIGYRPTRRGGNPRTDDIVIGLSVPKPYGSVGTEDYDPHNPCDNYTIAAVRDSNPYTDLASRFPTRKKLGIFSYIPNQDKRNGTKLDNSAVLSHVLPKRRNGSEAPDDEGLPASNTSIIAGFATRRRLVLGVESDPSMDQYPIHIFADPEAKVRIQKGVTPEKFIQRSRFWASFRRGAAILVAANTLVGGAVAGVNKDALQAGIEDWREDAGKRTLEIMNSTEGLSELKIGTRKGVIGWDQAGANVAHVMDLLDDHNGAELNREAKAFRQKNADQLIPEATVARYQDRLQHASSSQEALRAIAGFMSFYRITVGGVEYDYEAEAAIDPGNAFTVKALDVRRQPVWRMRALGGGFMNTFRYLPVGLTDQLDSHKTSLSNSFVNGRDYIGLHSAGGGTVLPMDTLPDREAPTIESTILHETGHGLGDKHATYLTRDPYEDKRSYICSDSDMPGQQSSYASEHKGKEGYADTFAAALSQKNTLGHPDEVCFFNSGANMLRLWILRAVELQYPGSTADVMARKFPGALPPA